MRNNPAAEKDTPLHINNSGIRMDKAEFQLVVGRRLAELRASIRPKLSQARLAAATNLNQNVIQRLESGGGTIDNLLVVLNYYLNENYNLNHLLAEFNAIFPERLSPADKQDSLADYFEIPL